MAHGLPAWLRAAAGGRTSMPALFDSHTFEHIASHKHTCKHTHAHPAELHADSQDMLARLYRSMMRTHGGGVGMGACNSAGVVDIVVRLWGARRRCILRVTYSPSVLSGSMP